MFKHKDWTIRLKTLKNLTDYSILNDLAQKDENEEVRHNAKKRIEELLDKIDNQDKIIEIAKKDDGIWVRKAAVRKIRHQPTLLDILLNDKDKLVRDEAVNQITDKTILEEIALNDEIDDNIRVKATKQIDNFVILENIYYKNKKDDDSKTNPIADTAFEKLSEIIKTTNNQELLINVATGNYDCKLRNYAVLNPFMENQDVLISLAINDDEVCVRKSAISKVTNTEVLNELITFDNDNDIKAEIIKNPYYMNNKRIDPFEN